jgi:DNA-binding Xre family transcriptional regulator
MGKIINPNAKQMLNNNEIQQRLEFLQGAVTGIIQTQRFMMGLIEKICAGLQLNIEDIINNYEVIKKQDGTLILERKVNEKEKEGIIAPLSDQGEADGVSEEDEEGKDL